MALVVLLRGVNVGGARTFRPSEIVKELADYDVVNIGAAGTFVVRKPIAQKKLRAELQRRLPFEADIMICEGREFMSIAEKDRFLGLPSRPEIVRFLSVSEKPHPKLPPLPIILPADGEWLLRIVASEGRFVFGAYRRHMKAITYLGRIEKIFGVPLTTRNWNTVGSIISVLKA